MSRRAHNLHLHCPAYRPAHFPARQIFGSGCEFPVIYRGSEGPWSFHSNTRPPSCRSSGTLCSSTRRFRHAPTRRCCLSRSRIVRPEVRTPHPANLWFPRTNHRALDPPSVRRESPWFLEGPPVGASLWVTHPTLLALFHSTVCFGVDAVKLLLLLLLRSLSLSSLPNRPSTRPSIHSFIHPSIHPPAIHASSVSARMAFPVGPSSLWPSSMWPSSVSIRSQA